MAVDRHQVDLSIKKTVYDDAMKRMKALQRWERDKYGVKRTSLADIGRAAIMAYTKADGADYEPRIVRSPAGEKPKREPFRFDIAAKEYERQKRRITANGHRVTQVVEEALKRFTATGALPWDEPEQTNPDVPSMSGTAPQQVSFSN